MCSLPAILVTGFTACTNSHLAVFIHPDVVENPSRPQNMTEVTVTVPDGVYGGDEFTLEYEGTQLAVICPAGCRPGDAINLQIDIPPAQGNTVNVVVPRGCYPGDEFTVEFDGQAFNIAVPDGCRPGDEITVEVPSSRASTAGGGGIPVTDELFDAAFERASKFGNKPDPDILRWALTTYCENNGDIEATFAAMGDDPAEALAKPKMCDTPEKFAANYVLGYMKVRR